MAQAPRFKVHQPSGEYVASCKYVEDAAMIVAGWGDGAKIRDGRNRGKVLWHEGAETFEAGESYDGVAKLVYERIAK